MSLDATETGDINSGLMSHKTRTWTIPFLLLHVSVETGKTVTLPKLDILFKLL